LPKMMNMLTPKQSDHDTQTYCVMRIA